MHRMDLGGDWRVTEKNKLYTCKASVPGVIHTDLLKAKLIPDPFYRRNELDLQWIGERDWVYERTFNVSREMLQQEVILLECDGLDTVAHIVINNHPVGDSDNMFIRYRFPVKQVLKTGENHIRIEFKSAEHVAAQRAAAYPYPVPFTSQPHVHVPNRNFLRKAQCHSSWDWGPAFMTCGIYKSIRLVGYNTGRLLDVTIHQRHQNKKVDVTVQAYFDAVKDGPVTLTFALGKQTKQIKVHATRGCNDARVTFTVERPDYWWPAGLGKQPLYDVTISLNDEDTISKRIGLRDIQLVRKPDKQGEQFYFSVNGQPVFIKGSNWIPADSFTSRVDHARYKDLLTSAKEGNQNMIRVWGGGLYEDDAFYDICDELGLMVWQDFMFACAMYPVNKEFIASIQQEVQGQIRRLMHHPCIALWCGNNENELALNWFEETKAHRDRYLADYDKLYLQTIGPIVEQEDPGRSYWPSSPCNAPGAYGDCTSPDFGDQHYWEVWHRDEPFSAYLEIRPRFNSEFGFQSFPSMETVRSFTIPEDLCANSTVMEHHERGYNGIQRIVVHILKEFKMPKDFRSFVYVSQVSHANGLKIGCEHWRRIAPSCMGLIYWQLNDIWPVISWASIEYDGRWKLFHYVSKRFFAPLMVSSAATEKQIEFLVTNETATAIQGKLVIEIRSFSGAVLETITKQIKAPRGKSTRVAIVPKKQLFKNDQTPETVFAAYRLETRDNVVENYHFFTPLKQASLPKAKVVSAFKEKGNEIILTLTSATPAYFVALSSGKIPGIFSDNMFHLYPDSPRTIAFTPKKSTTLDQFKKEFYIQHLEESY